MEQYSIVMFSISIHWVVWNTLHLKLPLIVTTVVSSIILCIIFALLYASGDHR